MGEALSSDQIDAGEARSRLEKAQAAVDVAGEDDVDTARRELAYAEALVSASE